MKSKFRPDIPADVKLHEQRRGPRVNSRARIALEWSGAGGGVRRVEGFTRVVGGHGCLALAPEDLPLEQRLRVTNLANERTAAAMVVWKGRESVEGYELGIELSGAGDDFWGVGI